MGQIVSLSLKNVNKRWNIHPGELNINNAIKRRKSIVNKYLNGKIF